MAHGPDIAAPISTSQFHRKGAATMAKYTVQQNEFDTAIREILSGAKPSSALPPQVNGDRVHPGSRGARSARQSNIRAAQGYRAMPRRPLRIPGR